MTTSRLSFKQSYVNSLRKQIADAKDGLLGANAQRAAELRSLIYGLETLLSRELSEDDFR